MFKNEQNLTEAQYLDFYSNHKNIPFEIFDQPLNHEIKIDTKIALENNSSIIVWFKSDTFFNYKLLLSSQTLRK